MSDVVKVLERELAQLETSLRKNPTFIKIERIRELLATYRVDSGGVPVAAPPPSAPRPSAPVERNAGNMPTKRSRVYEVVEELIRTKGPTHRKVLLAEVTARGIMGTEKNPMQSMAIYLSDAKDRFESVGDGVWTLRDRSEERIEAPADMVGASE
jgi:hypothetical protein